MARCTVGKYNASIYSLCISIPGRAPNAFLIPPYIKNCELTNPAVMTGVRCENLHVPTHSRAETGKETPHSGFFAQSDQTVHHGPLRSVALVDLRQQRVGGLRSARTLHQLTWERIAAAKPATIPDPRVIPNVWVPDRLARVSGLILL